MNEFSNSCSNVKKLFLNRTILNIKKACLIIERDGKKNCPVDQGILRASIFHDVGLNMNKVVGKVGSSSEIAPYVHQGTGIYAKDGNGRNTPWKYNALSGKYKGWHITKGQKPKPFLEKAKVDNIVKIQEILKEGLT